MVKRKNQIKGKRAKAYGDQFEKLIEISCNYYKQQGLAYINKTFPPFIAIGRKGNRVTGFYEKTGQPDFAGTLKNGQSIAFEAKHTNSTNIPFKRVGHHQKLALKNHYELGAESFILIAFKLNDIYKVPIIDWLDLEKNIGKKSVNEKNLAEYKLDKNKGLIKFIKE